MLLHSTNGALIDYELDLIEACVYERINLLLSLDYTNTEVSPMDLVRGGFVDCSKLFVKNEPHKVAKLLEHRERLIVSLSIIDNVIAYLLCHEQNQAEIDAWENVPSKPGMGLDDDSLVVLQNEVTAAARDFDINQVDVSAWDWCFQDQDALADVDMRVSLADAQGLVFEQVLRGHVFCMMRKVFVLSDGRMYQQLLAGIMPSGWFNTSSTNSRVKTLSHWQSAYWARVKAWAISMGDDGVERRIGKAVEYYRRLGKRARIDEVSIDDFEFCSTHFISGTAYPVNVDKQLFNLLSSPDAPAVQAEERLDAFHYEMRNHPDKKSILALVCAAGWGLLLGSVPGASASIGFQSVIGQNSLRVLTKTPRDCTARPTSLFQRYDSRLFGGCSEMNSPAPSLWYPIPMTKSKNQKQAKPAPKQKPAAMVMRPKLEITRNGGRPISVPSTHSKTERNLPQFAYAQMDAFSEGAEGVKVPDDATAPSCTTIARDEYAMSTNTTGGAGFVFRGELLGAYVALTPVTSGSWTIPASYGGANNVSNAGAIQAAFTAYRTVAYGIAISTRQSALNASGYVHVALVEESYTGSTWNYPTTIAAMEYSPYYRRVPIADLINDVVKINGLYTDMTAFKYNGTTTLTYTSPTLALQNGPWMSVLVWVEGPASIASVVDVDVIHHFETIVGVAGNGTLVQATKAAPHSPIELAATSHMVTHIDPIRVVHEDQKPSDWIKDASDIFHGGIAIAQGVVSIMPRISKGIMKLFA